jgi:plasmid maintenance system antidote protein VapI
MKKRDFLNELHIGQIIKEIAGQKGISSKELAHVIHRYHKNSNRIYQLNDMDIEDIIHISHLLKYNILDHLVNKYLPHLLFPNYTIGTDSRLMKLDIENKQIIIYDPFDNCNFLKKIEIGQHIKKWAEKMKWTEMDMTKLLDCSQGTVSNLYRRKSLKVKTLIQISKALNYHFIAEVYLSQMMFTSSINMSDGCIITLNPLQVCIKNSNEEIVSLIFQLKDAKKKEVSCTKIN